MEVVKSTLKIFNLSAIKVTAKRFSYHDSQFFGALRRRKPLKTTNKLAPISANTAIHIDASSKIASSKKHSLNSKG